MWSKLTTRLRNSDVDYRLLVPLLLSTVLVQVITAVIRITTSYRAVELGLSIVWLGVIAAAFAIFPIFIAVQVGRFIDRGHDAHVVWTGSALLTAACAGFAASSSATGLLAASAFMGVGHLMLMASQQMLCVRAASPLSMERVFGNYMVAGAIGQGIGPYIVGWTGGSATVPPTQLLFTVGLAVAVVSLAVVLTIRPGRERPHAETGAEVVPVGALLRVPGLLAVVVAGVVMVSASDIILIYVPLLGAERGIDVKDIGLLLTMRAAASMVARLFYPRMVETTGHWPLMIASTFACAAAFGALAAPVSLLWMYVIMAVMGFSFGLATTLSITIVVDLTTAGARGTANSLRIMGNRIGQFVLPFGAGLVAAATGLSGLLLAMAAAIAAAAGAMQLVRRQPRDGQ
jgi:MFS family permease